MTSAEPRFTSSMNYPRHGVVSCFRPLERVLPTRVGLGAGLPERLIDEIHLQYPFYGSRRLRNELEDRGHRVNRKRVHVVW